jgi:hypothetical protein
MNDNTRAKKQPVAKTAAPKKAPQTKRSKEVGATGVIVGSTVRIELKIRKNGSNKKVAYWYDNNEVKGDVGIETNQGQQDGNVIFYSNLPFVVALYPQVVQNSNGRSDFTFEARSANSNNPITIKIPKAGKKNDEYKYSVALFDGSDVVAADPKIRIAN